MRKLSLLALMCILSLSTSTVAAEELGEKEKEATRRTFELLKMGKYEEASIRLFRQAYHPTYRPLRMQLKYMLGITLMELKFYQAAAFQFVDVIRDANSKYVSNSLEKLTIVADRLNDDTFLKFALARTNVENFPKDSRDLLFFRVGEFQYYKGLLERSTAFLSKVPRTSPFFPQARYLQGLASAELKNPEDAIAAFRDLVNSRDDEDATDANRVSGNLGLARSYYQKKDWDRAVEYYRKIPRDTEAWHDALFEMSWAFMQSAKFRSVLSNLHSLHSEYYENHFYPESVLLRAIVYLYICQYDEMEKTLNLFESVYTPIYKSMTKFAVENKNPISYYAELSGKASRLPQSVTRSIAKEGDVRRTVKLIQSLKTEDERRSSMSPAWRKASVGQYVQKALYARNKNAQVRMGRQARAHLITMVKALRGQFEQHGFARYEMLNGKKEALKKQMASRGLRQAKVETDKDRDFYIQNGFDYWPFKGEYWLDEIGNYYYLGTQQCE